MTKGRKVKKEAEKKKCFDCSLEKTLDKFFKSNNPNHQHGVMNLCKECSTPKNTSDLDEFKRKLYGLDRPFINEVYYNSLEEVQRRNMSESAVYGIYLKNIQMKNSKYEFSTWKETEEIAISLEHLKSNNVATDKQDIQENIIAEKVEFTSEDEKVKTDCIRLLGYDPFAGYSIIDQKFLYSELVTFLDEDTLEDQYKISVIIQIVNNNNQIRKIDLMINNLSSDSDSMLKNSGDIKNLTSVKKQIVDNNDKLAKENSIALKHRGDKKAGRSTLGYLMKDLRELGFENAEEDYYDMRRAHGMRVTADISNQSILSQLNFDEKDIEDMFKEQRDLLLEVQRQKEEVEEKLRLANITILELKKKCGDDL